MSDKPTVGYVGPAQGARVDGCTCTPALLHEPDCALRPEMRAELLEGLATLAAASEKLKEKTDAELADLLLCHVWNHADLTSPVSVLLEAVIDRLKGEG